MVFELGDRACAQTAAVTIVWFENAVRDLVAQRAFIARETSEAAQSIAQKISRTVELLEGYQAAGRAGRVTATRELIIAGAPYVIPYRTRADRVEILRVFHSSRRWPSKLGGGSVED